MAALTRIEMEAERLAPESPDAFRIIDVSGFADRVFPTTDYMIDRLLPRGYVTHFGGHGGMGKSMLAEIFIAHCACGREWAGLYATRARCLYLSMEDGPDLVLRRLRNACNAYGLPADSIEAAVTVLDGTDAPALFTDYGPTMGGFAVTPAFEELRKHAAGVGLIVIDNASDAFDGNENDRRQVRTFMRALAQLARETNAAVLLLAHIDKAAARNGAAGNSYTGSTAWHNSARSRLALAPAGEDGPPILRQEKLNLGRAHDPITLAFTDHGVLIPERSAAHSEREAEDAQEVLAAIARIVKFGATIPTASVGPVTTYAAIESALPDCLHGREGKRRTVAAVLALSESGRIVRAKYTKPNRHAGERWELAQIGAAVAGQDGGA